MSPFAKILGLVWVAVLFAVVLLALAGGAMLVVFLIAAGVCPQLPPASRWWVLITRKMRAIAERGKMRVIAEELSP